MSNHEQIVDQAKDAINRVFGDTEASQGQTRTSLLELSELIDDLLEGLDETDNDDV